MEPMELYQKWLKDYADDPDTVADLMSIKDDPKEIETAAAPATVVFDANADGDTVTGLPSGGRAATDDKFNIKLPTPTRNGYVFEGWLPIIPR